MNEMGSASVSVMPGQTSRKDRFRYAELVLGALPRALTLLDSNPRSRTYGCCDRGYWHYKTLTSFPAGAPRLAQLCRKNLRILVLTIRLRQIQQSNLCSSYGQGERRSLRCQPVAPKKID